MQLIMKQLFKLQVLVSAIYLILNFKEISYGWSTLWSIGEVDIVNHLTNFNIHVKIIMLIFVTLLILFGIAEMKSLKISRLLQIIIILLSLVLLLNTQLFLARWIEINIFVGLFLILLTLLALFRLIWILRLKKKTVRS